MLSAFNLIYCQLMHQKFTNICKYEFCNESLCYQSYQILTFSVQICKCCLTLHWMKGLCLKKLKCSGSTYDITNVKHLIKIIAITELLLFYCLENIHLRFYDTVLCEINITLLSSLLLNRQVSVQVGTSPHSVCSLLL